MTKKPTRSRRSLLKVGQRVAVRVGAGTIRGVLIEDRGTIGVGGRRLWRVRELGASNSQEPPREFELPADQIAADTTRRGSARAMSPARPAPRRLPG